MSRQQKLAQRFLKHDHSKKTIQQLKKQLLTSSHKLNKHRIKIQLPFDFVDKTKQSTSRKSVDDCLNRYSNFNNCYNRRTSLIQKDQFTNLLKVNKVNWEKEMEGFIINKRSNLKRQFIQNNNSRSESRIIKNALSPRKTFLKKNYSQQKFDIQLKKHNSQNLPKICSRNKIYRSQQLTPWGNQSNKLIF